jgi:hypothetical protein
MRYDEDGWAAGPIERPSAAAAFTLLAPDASSVIDGARWRHHARTFFAATIELARAKKYPDGVGPELDAAEVDVGPAAGGAATRVRLVTAPIALAPEAREAGGAGARAIGGAGFDVLVARARRVWQVEVRPVAGDDARAPLVLAAVVASVLLAPIVPPEGGAIFGVKGARARLEALGWRS